MTNKIRVDQMYRFTCECGAETCIVTALPIEPERNVEHAAVAQRAARQDNRIAVLEGDKAELAKRLEAVVAEADKQKEIAHEFRSRATRMETAIRTAMSHFDGETGATIAYVKTVLHDALQPEPGHVAGGVVR